MPTSHLEIERTDRYLMDRLRAYRVYVDGRHYFSLKPAEAQQIEVEPGIHTVQLRIDYTRSRTLQVNVQPGEHVKLWCWPNARFYSWPFFTTFGWAHYIAISDQPQS